MIPLICGILKEKKYNNKNKNPNRKRSALWLPEAELVRRGRGSEASRGKLPGVKTALRTSPTPGPAVHIAQGFIGTWLKEILRVLITQRKTLLLLSCLCILSIQADGC